MQTRYELQKRNTAGEWTTVSTTKGQKAFSKMSDAIVFCESLGLELTGDVRVAEFVDGSFVGGWQKE